MRIFLAVFPPPEIQRAAYGWIELLREPHDGVSWVREENLHFTLRFLGEIGADGLHRANQAAGEAAAASRRFEIALGAPGAFPDAARPRVVWLGLAKGGEAITTLARDLDRALAKVGFDPAGQRFSPHLTLGRVRRVERDWVAAMSTPNLLAKGDPPRFTVRSIASIESMLSPRGSTYRLVNEAPLGGSSSRS